MDFMGNVHAHYYGEYIVTYKFHNKLASYIDNKNEDPLAILILKQIVILRTGERTFEW